ncbi:uncharacterized protein LOC133142997 [Syngnathus typhle]|uniref:uncharacterized protein LOC133142997 n=1 Tax=Syngnathus typhle TaxID=161592 RepID=UPI002A69CC5B|nr:uncharacterized protein LOC133142997 [Syngnathus typhle]
MATAEKIFMRQFVLLAMENRVPPCLLPKDMKAWLIKKRQFQQEYKEMEKSVDPRMLQMIQVAWTITRILNLNKLQAEVYMELTEEARLSRLLSRKVTLEGLRKFWILLLPQAERDTEAFLSQLCNKLLMLLNKTQMTMAERLDLCPLFHSATRSLVLRIIETTLNKLLEELGPPAKEKTISATLPQRSANASKAIGMMLVNALGPIPVLRQYVAQGQLCCFCTAAACDITQNLFQRFVEGSVNYDTMDYDGTCWVHNIFLKRISEAGYISFGERSSEDGLNPRHSECGWDLRPSFSLVVPFIEEQTKGQVYMYMNA